MTAKLSRRHSLILLFLLACGGVVAAQEQTHKSFNYGFVSPNTGQNLKLEQAIKEMNSAEATKLRLKAVNLGCVVRTRIHAFKALGAWSDGAEHSVMLRVRSDETTLRYLLSRLARDAQQKYVIYFHPHPKGSTDLYTLRLRAGARNLQVLSNALERAGIPFRTMVPDGGTITIYIIDLDRDLREKILNAARALRARVSHEPGNAKLFGDDLRQQAKVVFEQDIKNYETKNPNLPSTCDVQRRRARSRRSL